jgi:hypothetical protein
MKGWTLLYLFTTSSFGYARCQAPHQHHAFAAMQLEVQLPFEGATVLAFSSQKGLWADSNDYRTVVVDKGMVKSQLPVGARDKGLRLNAKEAKVELGEVFFLLKDESRHVTTKLWDETGRGYLAQGCYPDDPAASIAFVRYGFSKGLDTHYEPILDPELLVLDTNGKRLHTLLPAFTHAEKLSLAIGGDHIAAANHERLAIWNWRSGALLHDAPLRETERWPMMALSADGQQLALADGTTNVRLLHGPTWNVVQELTLQHPVKQLCFSPDAKTLYAVDGLTGLLAWQLGEGGAPLVLHPGAFQALAVAPDGQQVLVADAQTVYLLRL